MGLVLRPPLNDFGMVKRDLEGVIRERIRAGLPESNFEVHGNKIEISIRSAYRPPGRARLVGIVANRLSDPDILKNAKRTLALRLEEKARRCKKVARPMWLALFNDYFLADATTYRQALSGLDIAHDFSRIFLIEGSGKVEDLLPFPVEA